jgi:pimeloyl-ACP methyl ester carboxylesterase
MHTVAWRGRGLLRPRRALGAAAVVLLLAACGSPPASRSREDAIRSTATDVPFTGCDKVACAGSLDGAKYQIQLPQKWNGTLLLFSHGYRPAAPSPPDFAPVQTDAQAAPTDAVTTALLAKGYALAGSAFRANGWATNEGVAAGEQLHDFFVQKVGTPNRTYVWGESLGGLITEQLAEKHPDWIAGAAPLCGVLGGTNLNFDLAMDLEYGVKTLLDPGFSTDGFSSYQQAVASFERADKAIMKAAGSTAGLGTLLLLAALVDGPSQTLSYDGSTLRSRGAALVEGLLTGLVFGTTVRQEFEQRVGGNPSGNQDSDYASRVSPAERSLIETVAPGSTARNLALLAGGTRISPDPAARAKFTALGTPRGDIAVPTLTLHTEADPLVLVQNEGVFAAKVAGSTAKTADLVQLYTKAPARYANRAPYGAGHCNFTTAELTGSVAALDSWVRGGIYPTGTAVTAAFGSDPGLDLSYRPARWPAATS